MSYGEIAATLHISLAEARAFAEGIGCPKVFRTHGELVLIAL